MGEATEAVTDAIGFAGDLAGVAVPPLGAAGSLASLAVRLISHFRNESVGSADDLEKIHKAVAGALPRQAVVLVADDPKREALHATISQLASRSGLMERASLVIMHGLPEAPSQPEQVGKEHPMVVQEARDLVRDGRAEWWWIPSLDVEVVVPALSPVDREVAEFLVLYSGGDDDAADQLWRTWIRSGTVVKRQGWWTAARDLHEWASSHVRAQVGEATPPERVEDVYEALNHAAVQGEAYCGECVVRIMVEAGSDYDVITDGLDALAYNPTPNVIIHDIPVTNSAGAAPFWRYRFVTLWIPRWLDRTFSEQQRHDYQTRMLDKLIELHETTEAYDRDIARLARLLGRASVAAQFETRVATRQQRDSLIARADLLLIAEHGWPYLDPYLPNQLAETAERLVEIGDHDKAVECASVAVELAASRFADDSGLIARRDLAVTLHILGRALLWRGEVDQAVQRLEEAHTHNVALFHAAPTPTARRDLAATLHTLGPALLARREVDQACACWQSALSHAASANDAAVAEMITRALQRHCGAHDKGTSAPPGH